MPTEFIASDKFQGLCLVAIDGKETIEYYDKLPPDVREAIRNSPHNICSACVADMAYRLCPAGGTIEEYYIPALREMEGMIAETSTPNHGG